MSLPGRSQEEKTRLQYFGHVVRADNLCIYVLRGIVAGKRREEDHGDVGLTMSSNGLVPVAECVQHAKDRSAWRDMVSKSVTSDPQS